jgi:hypothetical protein
VREQRWPWLVTAGLMLAAAAAAGWSTYLYWLPCRGSMLEGTLIQPYTDDGGSYEDFEKLAPAIKAKLLACDARMDGDITGQAPWTSELHLVAMVLVGMAWLLLVIGLRWRLRTKAVAALPGLATVVLALAVAATIGDAERGEDHPLLTILPVAIEWSALLALAMVRVWQPEVRARRHFLRVVVVLWGTAAFGLFHQMLAYMIIVGFSERDWDEPPGTGYLTVATIAISAILTVIMTLRAPQRRTDAEPHQDHHSESLTIA